MGDLKNFQSNLFLIILDSEGTIIFLSDNFVDRLVGNEDKNLIGANIYEILDKSMHADMEPILKNNTNTPNKILKFELKNFLCLECSIFKCDNKTLVVGKNFSEANYFNLIKEIESLGKIGGWVLDVNTMSTYWSEQTYKIHEIPLGTPTHKVMGINFYHPDYQEKIAKYEEQCIAKSKSFDDTFKFITAKNKEIWVRVTGSPVKDETGEVVQVMGTFQNIDNYIKLSEKLTEKTEQLNDILENSPGMVYQFHLDNQGNMSFPYVSAKAFEIYEIQEEDFKNDPSIMLKMAHEDERDALEQKILNSAKTNEMFEWEGKIVTGTQVVKTVKARSKPRKNKDGSVTWSGIVMDITKEKKLEKEFNHQKKLLECSARLASLGEISAGIGHEINTPLAVILLKIDEIREQLETMDLMDESIEKNFDYVDEAVSRINSIVRSLKHLSRDQDKNKRKTVNIGKEVERSLDLIKELYRNNGIQIVYKRPEEDLYAHCPGSHIQQIVLNLISNAKDVLLNHSEPLIEISLQKEGDRVVLAITDNGPGIPEEIQDKIFLPFFTTKEVDKGTGIGLAMCYSLIENVNGSITFDTSEAGTSFKCRFIGLEKEKGDLEPSETNPRTSNISDEQGHTRILLIDDDPTFLGILSTELSHRSFSVKTANSGKAGLQMIKDNDFDVIISDLKMPEMDGLTLFEEMKNSMLAEKSLKIIMSGHITDEYENRMEKADVSACLQKPFKIETMIESFSKRH